MFEWTEVLAPPFPALAYYDRDKNIITAFTTDRNFTATISNEFEFPLVPTAAILQTLNCLKTWLTEGNEQHFLLVGEHGSAKRLIF